jgi:hypothetical protein
MVQTSGLFHHLVWIVYLKLKSQMIFQENLFDMMTDCRFQTIFKESARIVKGTVLPMHEVQLYGFPTIWINTCVKKAFLAVAFIKTGERNCLQLKLDMMHAVILELRSWCYENKVTSITNVEEV